MSYREFTVRVLQGLQTGFNSRVKNTFRLGRFDHVQRAVNDELVRLQRQQREEIPSTFYTRVHADFTWGMRVAPSASVDRTNEWLHQLHMQASRSPHFVPANERDIEELPEVTLEEKTVCAVCLDDMEPGTRAVELPCKHAYHQSCIETWLRTNDSCPQCRVNISPH